ncbi:MAG: HAMP domain-containing sensor histidine kinase [Candidatus Cloacimonetes bacterium]|jgi:nitrogen-specific signal transduction histidine kinase|nr:HAMP domain-containing histidine kinase [Candidatus Cloacimonadota bacterium]MDD4155472.1 HAMP domain-containing sensor histidine kinase [Candidatus Cloacimonadota bacterium]
MHKELFFFNDQGLFRLITGYLDVFEMFSAFNWDECLRIINDKTNINNFDQAVLYLIASNCELYRHNFAKSLKYIEECLELEKLIDNKILRYHSLILSTRNFRLLKDYEQAEYFLQKVEDDFKGAQSYLIEKCLLELIRLKMSSVQEKLDRLKIIEKDINFTNQLLSLKLCMVSCYNALTEYYLMDELLSEIESLLVCQNNPFWKCLFLYYKALSLFYKKNYQESTLLINNALAEADIANSFILKKNVVELAIDIYENLKDYKTAYKFHIDFSKYQTDFDNIITENRFIILKYIFDKKQDKLTNQQTLNKTTRLKSISLMNNALTYEMDAYLSNIKIDAECIIYWYNKNSGYLPSIFIEEIKMIVEAVDRTYKIINQMKTYWDYDNQDDEEIICINEIVKNVSKLMGEKLKQANIKLNLDIPESELSIKANKLFIEQIFINLFNNTIKAFEKTNKEFKNIIVSTKIENQKIHLNFIDNATGLPEINNKALFDPFVNKQVNSQGMGLGLALVKNFLDRFSGLIKAYNNELGGATFELSFPYAQKDSLTNKC